MNTKQITLGMRVGILIRGTDELTRLPYHSFTNYSYSKNLFKFIYN